MAGPPRPVAGRTRPAEQPATACVDHAAPNCVGSLARCSSRRPAPGALAAGRAWGRQSGTRPGAAWPPLARSSLVAAASAAPGSPRSHHRPAPSSAAGPRDWGLAACSGGGAAHPTPPAAAARRRRRVLQASCRPCAGPAPPVAIRRLCRGRLFRRACRASSSCSWAMAVSWLNAQTTWPQLGSGCLICHAEAVLALWLPGISHARRAVPQCCCAS